MHGDFWDDPLLRGDKCAVCSEQEGTASRLPRLDQDGKSGRDPPDDRTEISVNEGDASPGLNGAVSEPLATVKGAAMSRLVTSTNGAGTRRTSEFLIPASALARRLSVSVRTLWRLHSTGKLPPSIRLGGAIRWRSAEIEAWIAAGCPNSQGWRGRWGKGE